MPLTMFFSSPVSNITPAMTSVAMSRSDSRDSTSAASAYTAPATSTAYSTLLSVSPPSSWPTSHALARTDSSSSSTSNASHAQSSAIAMRRDSSNSNWMPSPYRSCMSSFGTEANSYLSDDDLLCPERLELPVETIPALSPKRELTTEEHVAWIRELHAKESSHTPAADRDADGRRKMVRFASHDDIASSTKPRRSSAGKRRQPAASRRALQGPQ